MGVSRFYWVLPSFTECFWVVLDVCGFYRDIPSFLRVIIRFDLVLLSFVWMLLDFTGSLPSSTEYLWVFTRFYWVVLSIWGCRSSDTSHASTESTSFSAVLEKRHSADAQWKRPRKRKNKTHRVKKKRKEKKIYEEKGARKNDTSWPLPPPHGGRNAEIWTSMNTFIFFSFKWVVFFSSLVQVIFCTRVHIFKQQPP